MLTNKVTRVIQLPHEPETTITVRMLSAKQLQAAREAKVEAAAAAYLKSMKLLSALDPQVLAAGFEARAKTAIAEPEPAELTPIDPLDAYDVDLLIAAGIVGWSYEDEVTPEAIDELDEKTRLYVARELIPWLEPEDERKNGSVRSTTPSKAKEAAPTNG